MFWAGFGRLWQQGRCVCDGKKRRHFLLLETSMSARNVACHMWTLPWGNWDDLLLSYTLYNFKFLDFNSALSILNSLSSVLVGPPTKVLYENFFSTKEFNELCGLFFKQYLPSSLCLTERNDGVWWDKMKRQFQARNGNIHVLGMGWNYVQAKLQWLDKKGFVYW